MATNGSTSAIEQARTVLDQAYPFLQAPKTLGDKSSVAQIEGIVAALAILVGTFPLLARITGPEVARNE